MMTIVMGILRHFLTVFGGYLFSKGLIDSSEQEQMIAALLTLAGIAWSVYSKIRANKVKTTPGAGGSGGVPFTVVIAVALGSLYLGAGCCSAMATQAHNSRVREYQALRVAAGPDGGVFAGVNVLQLDGYLGAWREEPGLMTAATFGDILTGLGAYFATRTDSPGDETHDVTITGSGNRVNVGGRDASSNDESTSTGQ